MKQFHCYGSLVCLICFYLETWSYLIWLLSSRLVAKGVTNGALPFFENFYTLTSKLKNTIALMDISISRLLRFIFTLWDLAPPSILPSVPCVATCLVSSQCLETRFSSGQLNSTWPPIFTPNSKSMENNLLQFAVCIISVDYILWASYITKMYGRWNGTYRYRRRKFVCLLIWGKWLFWPCLVYLICKFTWAAFGKSIAGLFLRKLPRNRG